MLNKIEKAFNIEQVTKSVFHKKVLFDLFTQRSAQSKISATDRLTLEEHEKFVETHPYRFWFLIKIKNKYVGTFYVTHDNHLGIFLTEKFQNLFEAVLNYILRNFDPLPALPSSRASGFNINVSANDKEYLRKFDQLGINPYQFTFKLTKF